MAGVKLTRLTLWSYSNPRDGVVGTDGSFLLTSPLFGVFIKEEVKVGRAVGAFSEPVVAGRLIMDFILSSLLGVQRGFSGERVAVLTDTLLVVADRLMVDFALCKARLCDDTDLERVGIWVPDFLTLEALAKDALVGVLIDG